MLDAWLAHQWTFAVKIGRVSIYQISVIKILHYVHMYIDIV